MKRMLIVPIVGALVLLGGAWTVKRLKTGGPKSDAITEAQLIEDFTFKIVFMDTVSMSTIDGTTNITERYYVLRRVDDGQSHDTIRVATDRPFVADSGECVKVSKTDHRLARVDCSP